MEHAMQLIRENMDFDFKVTEYHKEAVARDLCNAYNLVFNATKSVVEHTDEFNVTVWTVE